jgi:hypothetical protein
MTYLSDDARISPYQEKFPPEQAQTLQAMSRVMRAEPLIKPNWLEAFYRDDLNLVRGKAVMENMTYCLNMALDDEIPTKMCLLGHVGVGKSTLLAKLVLSMDDRVQGVWLNAKDTLAPATFMPADLLFVMMTELAAELNKRHYPLPQTQYDKIKAWFTQEKTTYKRYFDGEGQAGVNVGEAGGSLINQLLGKLLTLKADIKLGIHRETEVVAYKKNELRSLIELCNWLLDDANGFLSRQTPAKQWLFVWEEFDKAGFGDDKLQELFFDNAHLFQELRCHLLVNMPFQLYCSPKYAMALPFSKDYCFMVPDTPVYTPDHQPNNAGRNAVKAALLARAKEELFGPAAMDRLVVGSGGNLRDLFALTQLAARTASIASRQVITLTDVDTALNQIREEYKLRLGENREDKVPYPDKAQRLLAIFNQKSQSDIQDDVLRSLLKAGAIQWFNGKGRYGVHPLVVDILKQQAHAEQPINATDPLFTLLQASGGSDG